MTAALIAAGIPDYGANFWHTTAPAGTGVLTSDALKKLWDLAAESEPPEYLIIGPGYARILDAARARFAAEDLWTARGANWRRVKREGNRAYRAALRSSRQKARA